MARRWAAELALSLRLRLAGRRIGRLIAGGMAGIAGCPRRRSRCADPCPARALPVRLPDPRARWRGWELPRLLIVAAEAAGLIRAAGLGLAGLILALRILPRLILAGGVLAGLILSRFFFNGAATAEIYALSRHGALPISEPA